MTPSHQGARIRVLHIVQNLNYGGMERLIADIVRTSDERRFECEVMALQYLGRFAEELRGVARVHLSRPLPPLSLLRPERLAQQIAEIAPGVVHTHSGVWYKATLAARMAGVPLIIHTEHGRRSPDPWTDRLIDSVAARRTDVVVAVSDELGAHLSHQIVRGTARIKVIHNGVDTSRHTPQHGASSLRGSLGIPEGARVLGSIGRLEPIKGYAVMIRAFGTLLDRWSEGEPPHLLLAGNGSEYGRLKELASTLAVASRVHFLGWRDDIRTLHATLDLFTLSSHSEGTSVSLLEAMSAGLCPVVTDVGGNRSVLGPLLSHRLVAADSPEALASAWVDALTRDAARYEDGARARERVRTAFSLERMVRGYEHLYSSVTQRAVTPRIAALRPHSLR